MGTRRPSASAVLEAGLARAAAAYGFALSFERGDRGAALVAPAPGGLAMAHLIVRADGPYDEALVGHVAQSLSEGWSTASIAFAYDSEDRMLQAEPAIEGWKRRLSNRLNFLFPDISDDAGWRVSDHKIVDNAVCDTVRVKYRPDRRSPAVAVPPRARDFFNGASELYRREHLWLRAPSDGYFAVRDEAGFLVTATFTDKVDLDPSRISLVHGFDRATNILSYSGPFLPSSDAVEAAVLLAARPDIDYLVHTHASRLFTRNPAYRSRVLVPPMPYGEAALGDRLVQALGQVGDGFVVMAEHGDLFAGAGDADRFLASIARHCAEARRAGAA
ncbi:MAG: class II aldolase/adducin family protein [Hyphomicrobiaceae bacterium]